MKTSEVKKQPLVSVIIATYNRADWLAKAIQSVLSQTYESYEIIICDDGSTDKTAEIVRGFYTDKIVYLHQQNKGRSVARNLAFTKAKGKYIAFLDDDDIFLPEKLEKQIKAMEDSDFAMSYTSAEVMKDGILLKKGKNEVFYKAEKSGYIYGDVGFYRPITVILPTVMVRADALKIIGGFDEKMYRFEDTDMWRRFSMRYKILAIDEPLTVVNTHAENIITKEQIDKIYDALNYYTKKCVSEDNKSTRSFLSRKIASLYWYYAGAVAKISKIKAEKFLIKPFIMFPAQTPVLFHELYLNYLEFKNR
jgi:glycosyltransferase involved in cell wall biosynthesis